MMGTMLDTRVTPAGRLGLVPGPGDWSKRGVVVDVGPAGSPDSVWARDPAILREADMSYSMWYCAYDGTRNAIMFATSTDGVSWTKHGIVLSTFGTDCTPSVLKEGATYHMWFQAGTSGGNSIDYTTSPNGVNWSAPTVALLPAGGGAWDSFAVGHPYVVRDSAGVFRMYYVGSEGTRDQIGLATSVGYTNFSRAGVAPVLSFGNGTAWDGDKVRIGAVLPPSPARQFLWTMYYAGLSGVWQLGFAYSEDGQSWTRSTRNPFLMNSVSFDSAALESAYFVNGASDVRLYYTASDGSRVRIALAVKNGPEFTLVPFGTFTSRIFDSGSGLTVWWRAAWNVSFPGDSAGTLWVRIGSTSAPDSSWSRWVLTLSTGPTSNIPGSPQARYIQYKIELSAPSGTSSPEISSVTLSYGPQPPPSLQVGPSALSTLLIGLAFTGVGGAVFAVVAFVLLERRPAAKPPIS